MALQTMQKAAKLKFPPAVLDFVTFVWNGWGMDEKSPKAAMLILHSAFKLHHSASLVWLCELYRTGEFGAIRHALGYVMVPYAKLRYFCSTLLDPFSSRVFTLSNNAERPFFRS
jgi:hypothetical protein